MPGLPGAAEPGFTLVGEPINRRWIVCPDGGALMMRRRATWNPPSIAAGATATTDVTVTGVDVADAVFVSAPEGAVANGLVLRATVVSANTVRLSITNLTAGAIDPPSASYVIVAQRVV